MTKPSQINIQLPISSLFTLRGSRLLPPLMSSIPPGGRGNVLSVHLESDLYIVGIKATYVASFVAAFPDLKQFALQVVLQLAWALMKALRSESSSDVPRCNVCICTHCTAEYKRPSFGDRQFSTLQHFVLELRAVTLHTSTAFRSIAG